MAGCGEAALGTGGDVGGHDAGHGGDVDNVAWVVSCGAFGEEVVEVGGCVEHGFDVQSVDLVPAAILHISMNETSYAQSCGIQSVSDGGRSPNHSLSLHRE